MEKNNIDRNWFTKHAETLTVIAALGGGFLWMDSKFDKVSDRLSSLERDVAIVKTVMSIRGISCSEVASKQDSK